MHLHKLHLGGIQSILGFVGLTFRKMKKRKPQDSGHFKHLQHPSAEPFLVPRGDNLLRSELRRLPRASRCGVGGPLWDHPPFPPGERPCPCSPPLDPKPSHKGSLPWDPLRARHSPRPARCSPSAQPPWPACLTRSFHSLLRVPRAPSGLRVRGGAPSLSSSSQGPAPTCGHREAR